MPRTKSNRYLENILWLAVIYTVTAGGCFWFTNDKATDAVAAAALTALFILIGTVLRNHLQQQGRTHKKRPKIILSILAIGLVSVYLASSAKAATTTVPESMPVSGHHIHFPDPFYFMHVKFGGTEWSRSVQRNEGYAALPGCFWARVWDNGFAPVGGYKDDTVGMTVHWCGVNTLVKGRFGPTLGWKFTKTPTFSVWFSAKPTANYEGLIAKPITHYESCVVDGVKEKHGCYHIRITAKVSHAMPPAFISIVSGYPAVSMTVNARGMVTWWWYRLKVLPF
jgi:hypothetical protein